MAQVTLMLQKVNESRLQRGKAGTFLIFMHNMEGCMTTMGSFAFEVSDDNPLLEDRRETWRNHLFRMLNDGIIQ